MLIDTGLTGVLPTSFGTQFANLTSLSISNSSLSCCVPDGAPLWMSLA